jgi:hypothetical protein
VTAAAAAPASGRRTASALGLAVARHVAGIAAGLLVIPLVARRLGADGLGAWAILGTASFFLGVADLGTATAVQRAAVREDAEATRRIVGASLGIIALVAPLAALVGALFLVDLPGASAALARDLRLAAPVALAGGVVAAYAFPLRAFALAKGGVGDVALARAGGAIAQLGTTVAVLAARPTLVGPALGVALGALVEVAWIARAARVRDPALPLAPRRAPAPEVRAALRDGAAMLAMNLVALAALRADVMVLAGVAPLAVVAGYGVAFRAVDQSGTLVKQATVALLPRLGSPRDRAEAAAFGTRLQVTLTAAGLAALVGAGGPLLVAWGGPAAGLPEARVALALLAAASLVSAGHDTVAAALTLGGKSAWASAGPLAAGHVVNLALTFGLARTVGVWATAGGTLLGALVSTGVLWRRGAALLGWGARDVASALSPGLVAGLASGVTALALSRVAPGSAGASLAIAGLATGVGIAAAGAWARAPRATAAR